MEMSGIQLIQDDEKDSKEEGGEEELEFFSPMREEEISPEARRETVLAVGRKRLRDDGITPLRKQSQREKKKPKYLEDYVLK
jgi:hypothetical protein